jgi:hypothetical protein
MPQVELTFHGVAYILTLSTVQQETLCIEVEQKSDASRWRGDFTAKCECKQLHTLHRNHGVASQAA